MRILFSENLTFKFCGGFFLKVFLRLCFWIDCLLWTSNQKCHPCERCTKLADTKGKGHYSFLPGCGLQNMTLRNAQSPWKEKWQDIAEITRVQRIILRFFFFFSGWRVWVSKCRILSCFLRLLWPWFLYLLVSCWRRTWGLSECATGLGTGLHLCDFSSEMTLS